MRKTGRRLVTALSLLAIGVAAAVLVAGEAALPPAVRDQLRLLSPTVLIALVAWLGGMLWVDRALRRSPAAEADWPEPPAEVVPNAAPPVGAAWSATLEAATSSTASREERLAARERTETQLRVLAVELYGLVRDVESDEASDAILEGEWTDDRRATALLGESESASLPLRVWLFDLLRPGSVYRRHVRHVVAALHGLVRDEEGYR